MEAEILSGDSCGEGQCVGRGGGVMGIWADEGRGL